MASLDPHEVGLPEPDELGPDPEPIGTRFDLLLERAQEHRPHMPVRPDTRIPQRPRSVRRPTAPDVRHNVRQRAHVQPR